MIPQAAMSILSDALVNITNATISQSPSPSNSEPTQNDENGWGASALTNEVIGITALTCVALGMTAYAYSYKDEIYNKLVSYCFHKGHNENSTSTTTPLLNNSRSSINSDPEEEGLSCTDKMAISCNNFWSKMGF